MTIALINRGSDLRGRGLPNIIPAFPSLGGALYAAYLLGTDFGTSSDDLSGNGRSLTLGSAVLTNGAVTAAVSGGTPVTTFTTSQLCIDAGSVNQGCTIIAAATVPADLGTTVSVANSGNAQPYIADIIDPAGNTIRGFNVGSSSTSTSGFSLVANTLGGLALYGSRHSSTYVQAAARARGGAWRYSAQATTTNVPAGTAAFKIAALTAAAASGKSASLTAIGFYRGLLTDAQFDAVAAALSAKLALYGQTI